MECADRTVQIIDNKGAERHLRATSAALRQGFEGGCTAVVMSTCGPGSQIVIGGDARLVSAVGRDGLVRHVALTTSCCGRSVPMSVYTSETVNLVHREAGVRHAPDVHTERVMRADRQCDHYSVRIDDILFLACINLGPDSRAIAALLALFKLCSGRLACLFTLSRLLADWRRDEIEIVCQDRTQVCEAFYVVKQRNYAGPWSFAPEARLGLQLLHVVTLERARRRDFVRLVWALLRTRQIDALPGVTAFSCTDSTATATQRLPVQPDEYVVTHLPAEFQLSPELLQSR